MFLPLFYFRLECNDHIVFMVQNLNQEPAIAKIVPTISIYIDSNRYVKMYTRCVSFGR